MVPAAWTPECGIPVLAFLRHWTRVAARHEVQVLIFGPSVRHAPMQGVDDALRFTSTLTAWAQALQLNIVLDLASARQPAEHSTTTWFGCQGQVEPLIHHVPARSAPGPAAEAAHRLSESGYLHSSSPAALLYRKAREADCYALHCTPCDAASTPSLEANPDVVLGRWRPASGCRDHPFTTPFVVNPWGEVLVWSGRRRPALLLADFHLVDVMHQTHPLLLYRVGQWADLSLLDATVHSSQLPGGFEDRSPGWPSRGPARWPQGGNAQRPSAAGSASRLSMPLMG